MKEYTPLSLEQWCNAGVRFVSKNATPALGPQTLRGLPFLIGHRRARCFIGFENRQTHPVTVPLGLKARHVIVAHSLLESRFHDGEPVGHEIAQYTFRLANGVSVRVPVRERFEIAIVPTVWGEWPFLAVADQQDYLLATEQGPWSEIGHRQQEALQGYARDYYLWAWPNPAPDVPIESLTIEPSDRKFFVAAITLGHLEETPFPRVGKREVKITLPQPADARKSLSVEVDRGVATRTYALPKQSARQFLKSDYRGWGEPQNDQSSPSYVEIAASPSATVTVKADGQSMGKVQWGKLQSSRKIKNRRVQLEIVDRGRNWVHVTVLDDATGRPVPCRVHFRSPEGIPFQPHGHHNHVNQNVPTWHCDIGGDLRLGQITYAYIDGTCQGWLPRGDVLVDVARGFEYEPLRTRVHVKRGQRELTLRLKRWSDLSRERWFSGDTHVHFIGAQGAQSEAQGEDLNVVNLLQSQWGHLFTNTEDWTGRPHVSVDGKTIVYCSQENRQHILGHLSLLGLKSPVMPWCSDGPNEAEMGGTLDTTLSHWADACHAQGGTVVVPHLPRPNGEAAVLIATGRADAVEMIHDGNYQHLEYYRYLNGGYRLPLVGGTDKMYSEVPVGLYRTYARLSEDQAFTYDNWLKAVRAGRTFLSGGPLLRFTVNGAQIGDTIRLPGNGGVVEVEAEAESIFPLHTLQIVERGRVVASTEERHGMRRLRLTASLKLSSHTWLAARCGGPGYNPLPHNDLWRRGIMAHTSPVYIAVGGNWWMGDPNTAQYMLTLIEGGLSYLRQRAPQHPPQHVTHHHHAPDHQEYLERPFLEARQAVHRRLHQLGVPH